MSKKRQGAIFDPRRRTPAVVTTLSYEYAPDHTIREHFHEEDQLVYALEGVMTVRTADAAWTVPPLRAVWVPARVPHAIRMSGRVTMKTLYLRPRLARRLPRRVCVLHVSPLLRELVLHTCAVGSIDQGVAKQARLLAVLLDQLEVAPSAPLGLPQPRDPRARRVAQMLLDDPSDGRSLEELCAKAGGSKRTIERAFRADTAMTFGRWRQQASLLHSIRMLAAGAKVTTVAVETGYGSASAFISMFRRALGTTPGEYFELRGGELGT